MCTATYIKDRKNRVIFTTNRDENAARPTSPPTIHLIAGMRILFPQDQQAGGTWVAVGDSGQISCILNGAEGEEKWLGTTAEKSRGQVLLDSFKYDNPSAFFQDKSMEKAHPFTLLIIQPGSEKINAIKWNRSKKWIEEYDANQPQIWSSFTLYPAEQREERAECFHKWSKNEAVRKPGLVWGMHQSSKENNGLLLENSPHVNTVSTTQVVLDKNHCTMSYYQMDEELRVEEEMELN